MVVKMKVSIIVPVYNVESYLKKCLESIINQTYKNIEIILIDDGSTDNSSIICDNYQEIDKRIKVIHQENMGLSSARNKGLEIATGELISFIDSDDYVELDFIEYLYNLITNYHTDIAVCAISKNSIKNKTEDIKIFNNKDSLLNLTNFSSSIKMNVMNKLYRKDIIKNIKFKENVIYEDILFNTNVFINIKNIVVSNIQKYHYLIRDNSLSNQKFSKHEYDRVNNSKYLYEKFLKKYPELKYHFKFYYYANSLGCINKQIMINKIDIKFCQKVKKEIRNDLINLLFTGYSFRRKIQFLVFTFSPFIYQKLYYLKRNK